MVVIQPFDSNTIPYLVLVKLFPSALVFVLLAGLASCVYSPDVEEFIVDVKKVSPVGDINLDQYKSGDTIWMYNDMTFGFTIDKTDRNFIKSEVFLDGVSKYASQQTTGSFYLFAAGMTEGAHQLRIEFSSTSTSGSLASRKGLEVASSAKTWILFVDTSPPEAPVLKSSIENGLLKLTWTASKKRNFVSYNLRLNNNYRQTYEVVIKDKSQTSYYDSAYSGGYPVNYFVRTNTTTKSATSEGLEIKEQQQAIIEYNKLDGTASLKWKKSKYPGAFGSYSIYDGNVLWVKLTNPNDTTYEFKPNAAFGLSVSVRFDVNDKRNNLTYSSSRFVPNPSGAKTTFYRRFYYSNALSSIMAYNPQGYLVRLNDELKGVDSVSAPPVFSFPYPGRYMFFIVSGGIAKYDLVTKQTTTFTTLGKFGTAKTPRVAYGSDNQVVFFEILESPAQFEYWLTKGAVDMSTGTYLTRTTVSYDPDVKGTIQRTPYYSDDGRYMVQSTRELYDLTGGSQVLIDFVPGGVTGFRPENNDEIIGVGSPTNIYKATDRTVARTISVPEPGFVFSGSYDPVTKSLFYYQSQGTRCYIMNIDTGQPKLVIAAGAGCVLIGGYLIDSSGYFFKAI